MSSLLWKGLQLETALGSPRFLALMLELLFSTQLIVCGFYWLASTQLATLLPDLARQYHSVCVVGFSGVLFGMKAVANASDTGWQSLSVPMLGRISMPPKYVAWLELVLIQVLTPRASFVGHLCGILAGAGPRAILAWACRHVCVHLQICCTVVYMTRVVCKHGIGERRAGLLHVYVTSKLVPALAGEQRGHQRRQRRAGARFTGSGESGRRGGAAPQQPAGHGQQQQQQQQPRDRGQFFYQGPNRDDDAGAYRRR